MNSNPSKTRKPVALVAAALLAAATLAACGGSGDHGTPIAGGPGQVDPVDPFFAAVQGQVSVSAETIGEPIDIGALNPTEVNDKEPAAI